jgi:glutathione S-transferase
MKLYYFPGSCALADHIVLEWIGAPYETVRMTHDGIRSPEYLALNPNGTVPLLIDRGYLLTQNVAILTYLADLHPNMRLLGDGSPRGRADVMRWLGFLNSDVHSAFKPIFAPGSYLSAPDYAEPIADTARSHVSAYLDRIDKWLDGRDWCADQRSVADPYLFVMLRWATRLHVIVDGLDNLSRFTERMYADAGVRSAILAEEDKIDVRNRNGGVSGLYPNVPDRAVGFV